MPAKNYQYRPWFEKVVAKINGAVFYSHGTSLFTSDRKCRPADEQLLWNSVSKV